MAFFVARTGIVLKERAVAISKAVKRCFLKEERIRKILWRVSALNLNFVNRTGIRIKERASVLSEGVKRCLLKGEWIRKILWRVSALNLKKALPVYIVALMFLMSGLAWTVQKVSAGGGVSAESEGIAAGGGRQPAVAAGDQNRVSRGWINRNDRYLMARVIEGEAANEPLEGKVAVGAVIINRTENKDFPKNVKGVVYQPLAFEAVMNGQYTRPVTHESLKAADLAIEGWDPTEGALYYWNPVTAKSKWIWRKPVTMKIGRHVFAE